MRIHKRWTLWGLSLMLLASACKNTTTTTSNAFKPLNIAQVEAENLALRSKIKYDSPDFSISATTNVRMKRDSIIWVSISSFGFEAARAVITRDTLMVLNKLEREVQTFNYEGLSRMLSFPITFDLVQSALLGNMARPMTAADGVLQSEGHYRITQDWGKVVVDNYVDEGTMKLDRVQALEEATKNSLTVLYGEFTAVENFLFPYNGVISLQYQANGEPSETKIDIAHSRVEVPTEPLSFPFTVPDSYTIR